MGAGNIRNYDMCCKTAVLKTPGVDAPGDFYCFRDKGSPYGNWAYCLMLADNPPEIKSIDYKLEYHAEELERWERIRKNRIKKMKKRKPLLRARRRRKPPENSWRIVLLLMMLIACVLSLLGYKYLLYHHFRRAHEEEAERQRLQRRLDLDIV